jgi:hypothetical protein
MQEVLLKGLFKPVLNPILNARKKGYFMASLKNVNNFTWYFLINLNLSTAPIGNFASVKITALLLR